MHKNHFNQGKKDKIIMFVASLAVVGACTYSGLYINKKQVEPQKQLVEETKKEIPKKETVNQTKQKQKEQDKEKTASVKPVSGTNVVNELDVPEDVIESVDLPVQVNDAIKEEGNLDPKNNEFMEREYHFDEATKLVRPVSGEILLDYSMDKTIYFPTLDQYKYHDGICFKGKQGQEVRAASAGVVKEIGNNEELGQFVVFELGDGYEMTYGEVDQLTVGVGDPVDREEVFAKVAAATKYYSLEGANLYFAITKDGVRQNPNLYFE